MSFMHNCASLAVNLCLRYKLVHGEAEECGGGADAEGDVQAV